MKQHYPKHKEDFTTRFKTTKLCQIQALMRVLSCFSRVQLCETPWTMAHQTLLSMGFSRQEHWSGLPFPSPGIFPTQGSNPGLLHCRWSLHHWATGQPPKLWGVFKTIWYSWLSAPPKVPQFTGSWAKSLAYNLHSTRAREMIYIQETTSQLSYMWIPLCFLLPYFDSPHPVFRCLSSAIYYLMLSDTKITEFHWPKRKNHIQKSHLSRYNLKDEQMYGVNQVYLIKATKTLWPKLFLQISYNNHFRIHLSVSQNTFASAMI